MRLLSSARNPPPRRNGRINVFLDASVTVLLPVSPGYVAGGLLVGTVPPDTFAPFLARKWVASVAVEAPPLKMLTSASRCCRNPGSPACRPRHRAVRRRTPSAPSRLGRPARPVGPVGAVGARGSRGPAGPTGPSTFQLTRDSLLWQAVLGPTRRRPPLPGLTHASRTAGGGRRMRRGHSRQHGQQEDGNKTEARQGRYRRTATTLIGFLLARRNRPAAREKEH